MADRHTLFPFSAIMGQERMKQGLIFNVINPSIGGVLIRGEKGTAKSTAVRSLAALLPERNVIEGCRCNCGPSNVSGLCIECIDSGRTSPTTPTKRVPMEVVELPLNATEDRVAGTLDIEKALREGTQQFEPGILARANGNILYVDEVNLLDDHIVDMLLDVAAMGVNHVEREGVSFRHQSRFVLVGTMNPEEGDIRPQLLDRFGIVVDVCAQRNTDERMEIVQRRLAYDNDPVSFTRRWTGDDTDLRKAIVSALERSASVTVDTSQLRLTSEICIEAGVDGHRADIAIIKTACAKAAFEGRDHTNREDILDAALFALPHRTRRKPFEEATFDHSFLEKWRQ